MSKTEEEFITCVVPPTTTNNAPQQQQTETDASIYFDANTLGGATSPPTHPASIHFPPSNVVLPSGGDENVVGMVSLSPLHSSLALGGCTPGLRRRREGGGEGKYATSIAELGLRFQRRRRHFAGSSSLSADSAGYGTAPPNEGVTPLNHIPQW
jgi:hypothetical protein